MLPWWAMAARRPPEPVDARIYNDVGWVLRRYKLRVVAAREVGHHTHDDGTAVDPVPAAGGNQRDWDATAGRLAHDLGWIPRCARSAPARPARSSRRSMDGYDGYPDHGSPRTCTGGCPAHIHVSWVSGCYGSAPLVPPCAWVMTFPVPGDGETGDHAKPPQQADAARAAALAVDRAGRVRDGPAPEPRSGSAGGSA